MATSRNRSRPRARRKFLGTFKLGGTEGNTRLYLSRDLDDESFPSLPGDEVEVELVCDDDGEASKLEVFPKEE